MKAIAGPWPAISTVSSIIAPINVHAVGFCWRVNLPQRSSANTLRSNCPISTLHRAPSAFEGRLSVLRHVGCGPYANGGQGHAVRSAPACGGDLPQDLSGSVLRAASERIRRPVRADHKPGWPHEYAARRAQGTFVAERDVAVGALRRARVVASDETGVRIEGSNSYQWVFRCTEVVVHQAAPTRGAIVVETLMNGHRPQVWCSDRYSAQQGHGSAHQTCLAHLARDVAYAEQASDDPLAWRLRLWLKNAFALANDITNLAASTINTKQRALEKSLNDILATSTHCDFARTVQNQFRRARDQLLTFALYPGMVEPTNNACERALRPAVIQRKVTNGYRAMWAAKGEADIRTVVDTARLKPGANTFSVILQTVTA